MTFVNLRCDAFFLGGGGGLFRCCLHCWFRSFRVFVFFFVRIMMIDKDSDNDDDNNDGGGGGGDCFVVAIIVKDLTVVVDVADHYAEIVVLALL